MKIRFQNSLLVALTLGALGVSASGDLGGMGNPASKPVRLETLKTHSRLSLKMDDSVSYEWKRLSDGFELELKGLSLADIGAPLGDEARWASQYAALRDPRLASIELSEDTAGVKIRGRWRFPVGAQELADPQMESFDYRDKLKGALVLDFWLKDGPTVAEVQAREAAEKKQAVVVKARRAEKKRAERHIARAKARVIAEDVTQFCHQPLTEASHVFLRFHPVHERVEFKKWFSATTPDEKFLYYEPKSKSQEAQYVRLALKLYRSGNPALAIRTIEFFDQEYPKSTFRMEMIFLRANALLKLGHKEDAEARLRSLLKQAKNTHVAMHAGMYLANKAYAENNYLAALEHFLWLIAEHPENRQRWVFHLGAAECARRLKQTERAAKEYQWITELAPSPETRAEGLLRMGDLYMDRFQYPQGLAAYSQALRHFKPQSEKFPPIHINRAEALYGLGEFDRAREAFKEFLDKFPGHPEGWRATFRLGEIEGRQRTVDAKESRDWFLETINRFPFTPGATLARLRLIPCADHAGFTLDSATRFFNDEAEKFDASAQVAMDRYKDFRALSRVRAYMTMNYQEQAVATAIDELKAGPRVETRRILGGMLGALFRKTILSLLERGKKMEALTFYEQRADFVSKSEGQLEPDFLLKLSQTASDLGLGKLAQRFSHDYDQVVKARARLEASGPSRAVATDAPKADDPEDPEVRMHAAEIQFTQAKALYMAATKLKNKSATPSTPRIDEETESKIRAALQNVAPESKFSYERELILGLLDESAQKPASALRHAAKARLLEPKKDGPTDLRLEAWTARLEARVGDPSAALALLKVVEARLSAKESEEESEEVENEQPTATEVLGVPSVPTREELWVAQSEILEKMGRWGEAAATYARAVEQGLGGTQARYAYARALLKTRVPENREKALSLLEKLAAEAPPMKKGPPPAPDSPEGVALAKAIASMSSKDLFWRRLASETLANERTTDKTKSNAKEGGK